MAYYILPTSNGGSRHGDHGEVVGDLLLGGAGEQLSHLAPSHCHLLGAWCEPIPRRSAGLGASPCRRAALAHPLTVLATDLRRLSSRRQRPAAARSVARSAGQSCTAVGAGARAQEKNSRENSALERLGKSTRRQYIRSEWCLFGVPGLLGEF